MSETKKERSEMKLTDLDKYYKEIFIVTNGISTWIEAYNDENGVIYHIRITNLLKLP